MLFLNKTPDLTELDYEIYHYISNHLEACTYMRIRDIAIATHTRTATIQRFCKKFECSGFSEFRIRLKLFLDESKTPPQQVLLDTSPSMNFLKRTSESDFQEKISKSVELLKEKDFAIFLGIGSSNIIAKYGALYFASLFKLSFAINDPITDPTNYLAKEILDKSCIIVLSVSGETKEIIGYLKTFNLHDANVISITNTNNSTVAKLSHLNIPYYIPKENIGIQDVTSQLPALFTLEYIARVVHNSNE